MKVSLRPLPASSTREAWRKCCSAHPAPGRRPALKTAAWGRVMAGFAQRVRESAARSANSGLTCRPRPRVADHAALIRLPELRRRPTLQALQVAWRKPGVPRRLRDDFQVARPRPATLEVTPNINQRGATAAVRHHRK